MIVHTLDQLSLDILSEILYMLPINELHKIPKISARTRKLWDTQDQLFTLLSKKLARILLCHHILSTSSIKQVVMERGKESFPNMKWKNTFQRLLEYRRKVNPIQSPAISTHPVGKIILMSGGAIGIARQYHISKTGKHGYARVNASLEDLQTHKRFDCMSRPQDIQVVDQRTSFARVLVSWETPEGDCFVSAQLQANETIKTLSVTKEMLNQLEDASEDKRWVEVLHYTVTPVKEGPQKQYLVVNVFTQTAIPSIEQQIENLFQTN